MRKEAKKNDSNIAKVSGRLIINMDSGERGMFAFPAEPKNIQIFPVEHPIMPNLPTFQGNNGFNFLCANFWFLKNGLEKQFKIFF